MNDLIVANETLPVNDESPSLDSEITIQRCPHDDENPYTMVRNELIRDMSISPECRWLIIYLLSNKAGWKINVQQVINHLKPHMGRNAVYKLFEEAIKSGYMKREDLKKTFDKKGKIKNGVRYFISETPKFKECLRRPDFRDADDRDTENGHDKEILSGKKEHIEESNTSLKVPEEPLAAGAASASEDKSSKQKSKREKPDFSPKVREVANQFINLLHKHCPVYRAPSDLTKFLTHVQDIIEKDKQDVDTVIKTFEWAVSDNEKRGDFSGWQGIIATNNKGSRSTTPAEVFRKHFSKLHSQMNSRPKRKFAASSDQNAALEAMEEMKRTAL